MRREPSIGPRIGKYLLVPLVLFALVASAQDYKIRAKVDLVEVPVTVKGAGDKLITGLDKQDFVVFEDGQRQTISNFTVDPVPLSAAVVVDTGLSARSLSRVQNTFAALAGAFSEFDEVAVYRYDKYVEQVLDFSKDIEHVEMAMKTLRNIQPDVYVEGNLPRGPFSIPGPVINGAAVVPPGQVGVMVTVPKKPAKVLNDAIFAAANDLGSRERNRRKMVLVVTDGDSSGNEHTFEEASQSLLQRGVEVYAIGLDQLPVSRKFSVLEDYAKMTGGDVYFANSTKSIEESYATATEQARNQYLIGYISNNEISGPGPVFRDITVDVVGRNLKTLHRKGYYQYP
jgi:VWFA-related protein